MSLVSSNLDFDGVTKNVNLPDPINPQDAATKNYVDNSLHGYYLIDDQAVLVASRRIMQTPQLEIAGTGNLEIIGALEIR